MDRALYSIEETRAHLGWHFAQQSLRHVASRHLPSGVIGCRRFVSAEAIAALISSSTTSVSPPQDAVRSRRPLANAGQEIPSNARVVTRARKSDAG